MTTNVLVAVLTPIVGFGLFAAFCLYAQHAERRRKEQLESKGE